jgi:hypothetical protein
VETQEGTRWFYCFEYGFRESGKGYLELRTTSSYVEIQTEEE